MNKTDKSKGKYSGVIKFIAIILVCALFGAVVGMMMNMLTENMGMIGDVIDAFIGDIIIPVQWTVLLLLAVVSIALYLVGLGYVKKVENNRDDEVSSEKADSIIGLGITFASLNMILIYWMFGIQVTLSNKTPMLLSGIATIIFLVVYYSAYMSRAVSLIKRISPEKRGNPLEMRFQKDWQDSCDEGEKMVIYQAAFATYKLLGSVLLLLWVITVLISMFFDIGYYPVTIITILWLTHTIVYQFQCAKLNKKKLN